MNHCSSEPKRQNCCRQQYLKIKSGLTSSVLNFSRLLHSQWKQTDLTESYRQNSLIIWMAVTFFYFILGGHIIKNHLCIGIVSGELPSSVIHGWLFSCYSDIHPHQSFITPPESYSLLALWADGSHTGPKRGTAAHWSKQCSPDQGTLCLCRALQGGDGVPAAKKD